MSRVNKALLCVPSLLPQSSGGMGGVTEAELWSISTTVFARNFRMKFERQKFQTQNTAFA